MLHLDSNLIKITIFHYSVLGYGTMHYATDKLINLVHLLAICTNTNVTWNEYSRTFVP